MNKEFPTWEEVTKEIDNMFTEVPYKDNAMYGAMVMYDILLRKTSQETGRIDKFKPNQRSYEMNKYDTESLLLIIAKNTRAIGRIIRTQLFILAVIAIILSFK